MSCDSIKDFKVVDMVCGGVSGGKTIKSIQFTEADTIPPTKNRTHTVTIHNWANKTREQREWVLELETNEWLRANEDYEFADYTVMNGKYGAKVISFMFKLKSHV